MEIVKPLGYTPNFVAKNFVSSRTHTIGVVILEILHSIFLEVVPGIEEVTTKKNIKYS